MDDKLRHDLGLRLIKLLNLILVTGVFAFFWIRFFRLNLFRAAFYLRGHLMVIALFAFLYFMFGRTYEIFQVSMHRLSEMIYSQVLALLLTNFAMTIVIWLLCRAFPNIWIVLADFAMQLAVLILWDVLAHRWYFKTYPPKKTLIIYDMREGMEELISEYGMESKFHVEATLHIGEILGSSENQIGESGPRQDLSVLDAYEAIYMCGIHSHERNILLKYCVAHKIPVYVIPRIGDVLMNSARNMHLFHLPVLRVERYNPEVEYLVVKRLFDIVMSGLGIAVLSPLMLVVALLVRRDGGPAFYRQVRLTKDGKEFNLLKFRSMCVDAEKDGVARLSAGDSDDRITPVGRVIRKVRLDELPQLFNIFVGDMSIVGPRPERPEIAALYEQELPEFALRLQAKAGLTGLAQVYGKYNTIPYDKLMMDLMYIAHPSLFEDLRIILTTAKILFMRESTEGVQAGQVTAMETSGKAAESSMEQTEKNSSGDQTKEASSLHKNMETGRVEK